VNNEHLIREYVKNRDPKLRDQIIVEFLPIVKYVIGRMRLAVNNKGELEDIHSAGILGIIHALEDYDISKNTKFKTYATWRVQGFILDYLRKIDVVSRGDRAKIREIEKATSELTKKYGREPLDQEIAQKLNLDLAELYRLLEMTQLNFKVTFDQKQNINGEEIRLSDVIADESYESPFELTCKNDMINLIKEAIGTIPERARLIVVMYYYEEMTLAEIGKVLGLSESRVSRLLGKALIAIRSEINEMKNQTRICN
jgi:RNA polymerase sigma factor for flagellar operon FliA